MNFELNDEQKAIRETARNLLRQRLSDERLRNLIEEGAYADDLQEELVELGWLGTTLPEGESGGGLGLAELSLLAEALGEAIAPLPFISTAGALLAIQHAGSEAQRRQWAGELAGGSLRGSFCAASGDRLGLAPDAEGADVLIVADGDSGRLYPAGSFTAEPVESLDVGRRYSQVRLDGEGEPLPGDVAGAWARVQVLIAAESVGLAQRALDLAVDYAKVRKQFGQPIGSFQAISHRCVGMLRDLEGGRAAVLFAAWAADSDSDEFLVGSAAAALAAGDAGWQVPASAIQVCGGIGFTWEHHAHLLLRRGRVNSSLLETRPRRLARIADLAIGTAADRVAA